VTSHIIDRDMSAPRPDERTVAEEVDRLVDEQRILVLCPIERHGDLAAFRRAAILRRWLSQVSCASADA
jgi:hypothetical protein